MKSKRRLESAERVDNLKSSVGHLLAKGTLTDLLLSQAVHVAKSRNKRLLDSIKLKITRSIALTALFYSLMIL